MRSMIPLALAAAFAAGCANQPGTANTDRAFGSAVNAAKAAQVADPDAPSRARGPLGSDAEQAKTAVDMYEKSYTKQAAPTSVLNIGIGTAGTSTSGQ